MTAWHAQVKYIFMGSELKALMTPRFPCGGSGEVNGNPRFGVGPTLATGTRFVILSEADFNSISFGFFFALNVVRLFLGVSWKLM